MCNARQHTESTSKRVKMSLLTKAKAGERVEQQQLLDSTQGSAFRCRNREASESDTKVLGASQQKVPRIPRHLHESYVIALVLLWKLTGLGGASNANRGGQWPDRARSR